VDSRKDISRKIGIVLDAKFYSADIHELTKQGFMEKVEMWIFFRRWQKYGRGKLLQEMKVGLN